MSEMDKVTIYTDGACRGNPGPGGYGVIIKYEGYREEKSGGYRMTTNNRMEIMAAIAGLESLSPKTSVTIYSDSEYLVKAISLGWVKRWKASGWMRNKKDRAVNSDLWDRLLGLCEIHQVEFKWVRGHNSHAENERCDRLAAEAAGQKDLPADAGYRV